MTKLSFKNWMEQVREILRKADWTETQINHFVDCSDGWQELYDDDHTAWDAIQEQARE